MDEKKIKTLIFGKGYLGSIFAESGLFGETVLSGADIARLDEVERDIKRYAPDLIAATEFLVARGHSGIFNVCNSESISPYDLAVKAAALSGLKKKFTPISKKELDAADKKNNREKRVDTILNTDKLARTGFPLKSVHERTEELARYLLS